MYPALMMVLALLCSALLPAQITGRVVDPGGQSVPYANVSLLTTADSSLLGGTQTDEDGRFVLPAPGGGPYFVRVSFLTFGDYESAVINGGGQGTAMGDIVLYPSAADLAQVTVRSRRQLLRQSREGQILDVAASALSQGSSALQVLQRSPGVLIDRRNAGFSLNGRSGTQVLINGRDHHLPLDDLVALLDGMSADNIVRIELLDNPPAKYDANGTGGIINVILATGSGDGTRGNLTQSLGYGYGVKSSSGIHVSHGGTSLDLYGSYTFSYDSRLDGWAANASNRIPVMGEGNTDVRFESLHQVEDRNHNFTFGASRRVGRRGTVGGEVLVNAGTAPEHRSNTGRYLFANGTGLQADIAVAGQTQRSNAIGSLNYDHRSKLGKWSLYTNAIRYRMSSPLQVTNRYSPLFGDTLPPLAGVFDRGSASVNRTSVTVGVAGFDVERQPNARIGYTWGGRYSYSLTANEGRLRSTDSPGETPRISTDSRVLEWIAAGYLTANWEISPHLRLLAGVRYEYWSRKFSDDEDAGRRRGSFFPNLTLERPLGEVGTARLRYQRRIARPGYADVTSFVVYNDPGSIFTGNPQLRPAISDNVSGTLMINPYTVSLGYTYETHPIARYQGVEDREGGIVRISPQNIQYQQEVYLQVTAPWQVTPGWSVTGTGTLSRRRFELTYTSIPATQKYTFYTIGIDQQWSIGNRLTAELNGRYNGPQFNGTERLERFGWLNGGLRYRPGEQHSFQFAVEDILKSGVMVNRRGAVTPEAYGNIGTVDYRSEAARYRIYRLSYRWTFGNGASREPRAVRRNVEESSRL